MVELIGAGRSGHRHQSGNARVLQEAERAYKRENHSECALFLIFPPPQTYAVDLSVAANLLSSSETSAQIGRRLSCY